jgi:hypothetical protein
MRFVIMFSGCVAIRNIFRPHTAIISYVNCTMSVVSLYFAHFDRSFIKTKLI